jgi:hypothetical protein
VLRVFKIHDKQVKLETIWMLSNLITHNYIEIVMKYAGEDVIKCLLVEAKEDDQSLKTEAGIALYNLAEALNSFYLGQILSMGKMFLLTMYVHNVANVPTWLRLGIQSRNDVFLLQVSLGFVGLCLEYHSLPFELQQYVLSEEVKVAVEDCLVTMGRSLKLSDDEKYIVQQCKYILNWFGHELSNAN